MSPRVVNVPRTPVPHRWDASSDRMRGYQLRAVRSSQVGGGFKDVSSVPNGDPRPTGVAWRTSVASGNGSGAFKGRQGACDRPDGRGRPARAARASRGKLLTAR